MSSERTLIASVMFLSIGLGLIFGYCHGTAGFNAGYPLSGTSLQFSINTNGIPALAGSAATLLGILLLATAFVQAILGQARWAVEHPGAQRSGA
jgi:hypothetical protein